MEQKYTVYFQGKLRRGHDHEYVCVALAVKMNLSDDKINSLFKKKKVKIKSNLSKDDALRIARKFYHCGLVLRVSRAEKNQLIKHKESVLVERAVQHNFKEIFADHCPEVNHSIGYKCNLFVSCLLTLMLPLIYLSLIAGVVYALHGYFTVMLPETVEATRGFYYQLIMKTILPFSGFLLLILLVKPLFATYKERPRLLLKRSDNLDFFEFIDEISNYVGSKRTSRIYVNNDARATASFHGGINGLIKGNVTLTLGMPLVNSLSSQQLSGVIAHELGHFTHQSEMRINFLINSINEWLYSRAFEDDSLDKRIKNIRMNTEVSVFQVMLSSAIFCLFLVRYVMKLLLAISMKISFYLSRKMEFNADSYEAAVAGSDVFKETSLQLRLLDLAQSKVEQINGSTYEKSSTLFEDMPTEIANMAKKFDIKTVRDVEVGMSEVSSHVWDAHPADNERIEYAEGLDRKGVFLSKVPAKTLFNNLSELNRRVTYKYYNKYLCILKPKECMVENIQIRN